MYKRKLLLSIPFLRTPSYPDRSFAKSLLEGLEYAILLSFVDSTKAVIRYKTSEKQQKEILFQLGKIWIIIDDIQDEQSEIVSDELLESLLLSEKIHPFQSPILTELNKSIVYVNERIIKTRHWNRYKELTMYSFNKQKTKNNQKAGAGALALILALDPINMTDEIEQAIYAAGSWVQTIDDYVDISKDKKNNVHTLFTEETNPDKLYKKLSANYATTITSLVKREDFVTPFMNDLSQLVRVSRIPGISMLFNYLNA